MFSSLTSTSSDVFGNMPLSWRKSSRKGLQQRPTPSPLRIIKRDESADPASSSRESSSQTERDAPDPAADEYLTVTKRRSVRSRLIGPRPQVGVAANTSDSSSESSALSRPRLHGWDNFSPRSPGVAGSQTLNVKKTRQARSFFNERPASGAQTYRKRSMGTFLSGQRRFPTAEVLSASRYPPAGPSADQPELQSSPRPAKYRGPQQSGTPCVLCPHISVTDDCITLDNGQRSVWAAIEVSGMVSELRERPPGNVSIIVTGSFINHSSGLPYPNAEL